MDSGNRIPDQEHLEHYRCGAKLSRTDCDGNVRALGHQLWDFLVFLLMVTKRLQELKASDLHIILFKTERTGAKSPFSYATLFLYKGGF